VSFRNQQNITSIQYAYGYYLAGDTSRAQQISDAVMKDCREQVDYYNALSDNDAASFQQDLQQAKQIVSELEGLKNQFSKKAGLNEVPAPSMPATPRPAAPSPTAPKPTAPGSTAPKPGK
jgi:hypothetical protein